MIAIPINDHEEAIRSANEPTVEEIKAKATRLGFTALPTVDLKELTRSANEPTKEELSNKAEKLGLVTLLATDADELKRAAEEPTQTELRAHAEKLGFVAIPADTHREILRESNEPTPEELKRMRRNLVWLSFPPVSMKRFFELPTSLLQKKLRPRPTTLVISPSLSTTTRKLSELLMSQPRKNYARMLNPLDWSLLLLMIIEI